MLKVFKGLCRITLKSMKSNMARFLCRRMNLLSHSESSHLKDHCRINYFMSLLTGRSPERTFVAILMAMWVAITPLVDVAHDLASHNWFSFSEFGLCKVDCDTSEHKNTNLRHDCCRARLRDFTAIEIGSGLFFENEDRMHIFPKQVFSTKTLSPLPPLRAPPLS